MATGRTARRAFALLAATLMVFAMSANVLANAANPATITAAVNGNTVTLSGTWDWQSQTYPCISSRIVGWAVAWDDASQPGNIVPGKARNDPDWLVGTPSDNTVHNNGDCGTGPDAGGKAQGTWGPISHTYPGPGTYHVCVLMYDIHHSNGVPKNASELIAGGANHNKDNSSETNGLVAGGGAAAPCIPTTIVIPGDVIAKKVVDKATANPGDALTYTITLNNTGASPVTGVDVSDDISPIVPAHGTLTSSTPAATVNGNTISWTGLTINPGQTLTFTYVVTLAANGWPNGTTNLPNVVVVQKSSNCKAGSNDPNCTTITTVTPTPHVKVVKTADAQTVTAGANVGFTITVTSDGASSADNVVLNDPLPTLSGLGINWSISPAYNGPGSCSITGNPPTETLACNFGTLATGASATIHLQSATTAPAAGGNIAACQTTVETYATNLDNTVTITSSNAATATDSAGSCVTGNPHVKVVKTADAQSVVAGNAVGFTITVTSDGIGTANNVSLNDPLPTLNGLGINWSISPAYAGQGTCGINGAPPAETLACSFGNLARGASVSVHVTSATTAPAGGVAIAACQTTVANYATNLDNTVTITSSNAGGATSQTGVCVTGTPHVKVVKTPDAQTVVAGNAVGFTITVTNDGVGTVNAAVLNDALPTIAGLGIDWSINPAYAGQGNCSITGAAPAQTLGCQFGNLAQGASASVHVTSSTTAAAPGGAIAPCQVTVVNYATNLDNSVQITSSNAASATAQTGVCVVNQPHVSVTKTPDAQTVVAGNPVGFTITVKSDGTGTATAVNLSDALPTLAGVGINWAISPAYAGPGTCAITGAAPGQTLSCSLGDLAQGAQASVHVSSTTTAPAGGGAIAPCAITVTTFITNLDNTVNVTSQNAGSSTARTGICVTGNPHISVTKTPDAQTVVAGTQVGFTITVKSDGIGEATNVALSDALPTLAGLGINWSISPAFAGPGTCSITGAAPSQTLSCSLGNLVSGASVSVHVVSATTAPANGGSIAACQITTTNFATNLNNSVTITSSNAGSATAQTGTCVTSTPHITVTKTPDSRNVLAGNAVGFTIVVKSDGSGTANAVALNDALPTLAGLGINWSISPAFAGPGTCSISGAAPSQTLICAFGDLVSGTQASVHVVSNTTAPGAGGSIAPCQVTVVTYATNLNNSVQITSSTAASATAQTGICVSLNPGPAIHVVKTANPTVLPVGGGLVSYTYAVTNIGNVPLTNVTLVDDKCSPVVYLSGDTNTNAALDLTETWAYSCTATIKVTTTNTVVATGHFIDPNDPAKVDHTVTDQDQATVVVPAPTKTPTGSVGGATSPPKPIVTLPPTDESGPLGTGGGSNGMLMILILLAGIAGAVPFLVFGKRRQVRR